MGTCFILVLSFSTNIIQKPFMGNDVAGPRSRAAEQTASVNTFLAHMYYSVSETMPTGILAIELIKIVFIPLSGHQDICLVPYFSWLCYEKIFSTKKKNYNLNKSL